MSSIKPIPCARIAVVIVNWNGKEYTLDCLHSLRRQHHVEIQIVLVDNGSTDGSVSAIREQFPDVAIVEAGINLGYASGNNLGIVRALDQGFEYVLVLNNDTVLAPDCAYQLVMDLDRHPESAAAAPKSYYLEMPDHIYFAGGKIGRNGLTIHIGLGCPDGLEYSKAVDTEWINGCAMMIRRGALLEVGLFDPRFFLLFEDTDWSVRARTAGYRLRFVPEAKLWHKVSPSFGSTRSPLYLYYATRNLFLWIEKSFPLPQRIALFCFGLKRECFRTIIRTRNPADESAHRQRMAIWQGIWDYVLRRFGPQRM